MRKLLTLIAALTMCDAYGTDEPLWWLYSDTSYRARETCTSGGNITKPTDPTKNGYRFMGWAAPSSGPGYVLSQLLANPLIAGNSATNTNTNWTVYYDFGQISGTSFFSKNYTNRVQQSYNTNGACTYSGYCWCQINSFTANGSTLSVSNLPWYTEGSGTCAKSIASCHNMCSLVVKSNFNNGIAMKSLLDIPTN